MIELLGVKYNLDVEECLKELNLCRVESKSKDSKSKLVSKYPLPFDGVKKENCCNGIIKNHGLYTQCEKSKLEKDVKYCKGCKDEPYGNIDDRVKAGLYEYKDPKGKSPKKYMEVLKKLKISKETIEEELERLNVTVNPIHFEEVIENVKRGRPKSEKKVKETNGKKGRPKKESKVVEVNKDEEDLFATLIAKANLPPLPKVEPNHQPLDQPLEKVEPNHQPLDQPLEKVEPNAEQEVIVEEANHQPLEKVEPNAEQEVVKEVLAPPLQKVDKKAEAKAAKEAEKQKKAEAEKQKKAEEKAAKEAAKEAEKQKKAEEKAAKEAEKQKKAEEKAAKEAEKKNKQNKAKDLAPPLPKVEVEEEVDVVRKIEFEGKSYYKSKNTGVIYNMEQEVVGKWNTAGNRIDFEEEEEEEEYDD